MYRNARSSFSTIQQWRVFPRKAFEKKAHLWLWVRGVVDPSGKKE